MATLRFILTDTAPGGAAVASTESGSGSGTELVVSFDSRYVSADVALAAFALFVETVQAG